jgi:phage tail tape-measure protein
MLTRILIGSVLLFGACKKQPDVQPTPSTETKTSAAPSGAMTAADYEAKAGPFMDNFTTVFVTAGTDCDKLAAGINQFLDDNKATLHATKAFEKANPEAKKAFDTKMQAHFTEQQQKLMPALQACGDKKPVQDAMDRFSSFE